jgi:hypothetical protein
VRLSEKSLACFFFPDVILEIAKLNSKTSNNNIRLIAIILAINIAKLVIIALIILIIATPFKLAIITPLKYSAYKAIKGYAANSAS